MIGAGTELRFTIYGPAWAAARGRVASVEPAETRSLLGAALDQLESGWPAVRDLRRWVRSNPAQEGAGDDFGCVLAYVESELWPAFHKMATALLEVAADWPGCDRASTDDVDGWLSAFVRYVTILVLATPAATVPPEFLELVRQVTPLGLGGRWWSEFASLVAAIGDRSKSSVDAQDARGAVEFLTHAIPEGERRRVNGLLVSDVEAIYDAAGQPVPEWVNLLKAYFAAPEQAP